MSSSRGQSGNRHGLGHSPSDRKQLLELTSGLKAVAHPDRLRILELLGSGRLPVADIVEHLGVAQPVVSQHLKVLSTAHLLKFERTGRNIHYRLDQTHAHALLDELEVMMRPDQKRL